MLEPRLISALTLGALGLVIVARWIAMAVVIIGGAGAGKQARILTRCPAYRGCTSKTTPRLHQVNRLGFPKNLKDFPAYQIATMGRMGAGTQPVSPDSPPLSTGCGWNCRKITRRKHFTGVIDYNPRFWGN